MFAKQSVEENVPLAQLTTLGVGGPALFLLRATSEEQITGGLRFARERGCPVFILGGGSNLVVSDSGFPGLVLKIELSGVRIAREPAGVRATAAAGEEWDPFVQRCVDGNLGGIECLSGIPGTVGGTPVQNVGAYGQDVGEVILRVRVLDRDSDSVTELSNAECRFAYRASIFNTAARDRYIILSVDFQLRPGGKPTILYRDLQSYFSGRSRIPSIREVREAVLQIRDSKGMTLRERGPDSKSAGSFFKNPFVSPEQLASIEEKARASGILAAFERIPRFPAPSGEEKLSAAWLIEGAGFHRGYTRGRAGISRKHTLAIVNLGGASAQEILDLMRLIQKRVRVIFDVQLEPEPIFVGF